MHLFELFHSAPSNMENQLRQSVLDMLTPMAATKVPFITVQQVIDSLRQQRPGIEVDRALVLTLLNPNEVHVIGKIEGDRIYFSSPEADTRKVGASDEEREKAEVRSKAQDQAKKSLGK